MSENRFYESNIEEAALEWLEELGYGTEYGPNISPGGDNSLRESYYDVIIKDKLEEALYLINKDLPKSAIKDALREIMISKHVSLIENNKAFQKMLTDGVSVRYKDKNGDNKHDLVKVIDFDNINNNDFYAVNQYTVIDTQYEKRPDIVVFVNGIPISVFELKTASDENITIDRKSVV